MKKMKPRSAGMTTLLFDEILQAPFSLPTSDYILCGVENYCTLIDMTVMDPYKHARLTFNARHV